MGIIVQKFGGTSVADAKGLRRAAKLIAAAHSAGNGVVAVVSAQGNSTDELLKKAAEMIMKNEIADAKTQIAILKTMLLMQLL